MESVPASAGSQEDFGGRSAAVQRVIRTMSELRHHQLLRGRAAGLGDIDVVDLFAFLQTGTTAPARSLPSRLALHAMPV